MSNPKVPRKVHDVIDMDYLDSLPPDVLEWMTKFVAEFYYANHGKKPLHKKQKRRRENAHDNNARHRDVWNRHNRHEMFFGDEREWGDDGDE